MTTYIVLLRGINVGGNKMVPMADLKALVESLGYSEPKTLLQSGNLVLKADVRKPAELEVKLHAACKKRFGHDIDMFVRSAKDWAEIIAANPFPKETAADPAHMLVMVLKEAVTLERLTSLRGLVVGREKIEAVGKTLFIVFPDGIGTSKFAGKLTDKNVGTSGTCRNWNTVQKLAGLAAGLT